MVTIASVISEPWLTPSSTISKPVFPGFRIIWVCLTIGTSKTRKTQGVSSSSLLKLPFRGIHGHGLSCYCHLFSDYHIMLLIFVDSTSDYYPPPHNILLAKFTVWILIKMLSIRYCLDEISHISWGWVWTIEIKHPISCLNFINCLCLSLFYISIIYISPQFHDFLQFTFSRRDAIVELCILPRGAPA